jgi:hypothetical protein
MTNEQCCCKYTCTMAGYACTVLQYACTSASVKSGQRHQDTLCMTEAMPGCTACWKNMHICQGSAQLTCHMCGVPMESVSTQPAEQLLRLPHLSSCMAVE